MRTTIVVVPNQMARTAEELLEVPEVEEQATPEENAVFEENAVSAENAVFEENAVSAEIAVSAENAVSEENAALDMEAVLDDEQVVDFKDVIPNKETVGQASRAGARKGPPFAEQVLDVNGEIQLRELGPGEMQYVAEAPRRRMRQKTTPAQTSTKPSLCAMREGGESMDEPSEEEEDTGAWWGQMEELVSIIHQRLRHYIKEELYGIQTMEVGMAKNAVQLIKAAQSEVSQLVNQISSLAKISVRTMQLDVEMIPEVLQTRTVPLDEVRADLQGWKEAFQKEMENLTDGPVKRMSAQEYEELQQGDLPVELLPMKAVATMKPPARRKGRLVVWKHDESGSRRRNVSWRCLHDGGTKHTTPSMSKELESRVHRRDRCISASSKQKVIMCNGDRTSKLTEGYGAHRGRRKMESQLCSVRLRGKPGRLVGVQRRITSESNLGVARKTTSVSSFKGATCVEAGGSA